MFNVQIHIPILNKLLWLTVVRDSFYKAMGRVAWCYLFIQCNDSFQFAQFNKLLERLADQPYSRLDGEFIMQFRRELQTQSMLQEIPKVSFI